MMNNNIKMLALNDDEMATVNGGYQQTHMNQSTPLIWGDNPYNHPQEKSEDRS